MRARSGNTVLRKRARLRRLTKGFRAGRHRLYRLVAARISLDRKSLSELAIHHPDAFTAVVELAKKAIAASKS